MPDMTWQRVLWWIGLVVAPLTLCGIELFHPAGFTHDPGMFEYLSRPEPPDGHHHALDYFGPDWWFVLHMIQTPLVCLVAGGLVLLTAGVSAADGGLAAASAWISHIATFVFAIYYTALDSIGGFGLARMLLITKRMSAEGELTDDQLGAVARLLDRFWQDPWVGGVGSVISLTGSWAVFAAALTGAAALFLQGRLPRLPLVLLVLFGWELQVSHAMPHGPIAFALLAACALWLRIAGPRSAAGGARASGR